MAAGTKRPNLQTAAARRHSLHRKVSRARSHFAAPLLSDSIEDAAQSRMHPAITPSPPQTKIRGHHVAVCSVMLSGHDGLYVGSCVSWTLRVTQPPIQTRSEQIKTPRPAVRQHFTAKGAFMSSSPRLTMLITGGGPMTCDMKQRP